MILDMPGSDSELNKLDLCLLNDYLNGYKEKLSLGAPKDGNVISLDQ